MHLLIYCFQTINNSPAFLAGAVSFQEQILFSCDLYVRSIHFSTPTSFGPPPEPLLGRQSFWDQPGLQADRSVIEASMVEPSQMARYLASVSPHNGDWLLALPIANCGLRLEIGWHATWIHLVAVRPPHMPVWVGRGC